MTQPNDAPRQSFTAVVLSVALLAVVAIVIWAAGPTHSSPDPAMMKALAEYVMTHGELAPIPPGAAKAFGVPSEPLLGPQILVRIDGTTYGAANPAPPNFAVGVRGIQVRQRPDANRTDVFLLNATSETEAYFYLTSESGTLDKAFRMDNGPSIVLDADELFAAEIAFWQNWLATVAKGRL